MPRPFDKSRSVFRQQGLHLLLYLAVGGLVFLAYAAYWGNVRNFVTSFDSNTVLFEDFDGHYYPTGHTLFATKQPAHKYFYSPAFAIFLTLFCWLPLPQARILWGIFQFVGVGALLWVSIHLALDAPHRNAVRSLGWHGGYALIFFLSVPLLHNLSWGQISVWITALILWSAWLANKGFPRAAALALAVAVAFKYYPILFLAPALLKKDFRYCAYVLVFALAFMAVLPAMLLGVDATIDFYALTRAGMAEASATWMPTNINSQYWGYVMSRLIGPQLRPSRQSVFILAGIVLLTGNVLLGAALERQADKKFHNLSWVLLFTALPFVIKTSWPHYFVYLPFVYFVLIRSVVASGAQHSDPGKPDRFSKTCQRYSGHDLVRHVLIGIPLTISLILSGVIVFNIFTHWVFYSFYGMLFWSNALALLSAYLYAFFRLLPVKQQQ